MSENPQSISIQSPTYQAIARRYRPQNFSSVVGQDSIVATLKNALSMNKISHAYLFCGLRGTGKTTLARLFAKALNCENRLRDSEPCNDCRSCKEITLSKSLDVIEIDGASNRGIDDIREITDNIGYATANSKYKIVIIDEVHMLTKEAFNALLKTLEEPPANVKFLFATTEPHKVLPTILSRCQRFDLNRISSDVIKKKLKEIALDQHFTVDEAAFDLIVQKAEGSMRDAESLFDQLSCCLNGSLTYENVLQALGLSDEKLFLDLATAIYNHDLKYAFKLAGVIYSSGKDPAIFLEQYAEHLREVLAIQLNAEFMIEKKSHTASLIKITSLYTEEQLFSLLDFVATSLVQFSKSSFKRIHLEMILLHVLRSRYQINLATLTKRLIELENHTKNSLSSSKEKLTQADVREPKADVPPLSSIEESSIPIDNISKEPEEIVEQPFLAPQELSLEKKDTSDISKELILEASVIEENSPSINSKPAHFYETLLRFTAVELEGSVKK